MPRPNEDSRPHARKLVDFRRQQLLALERRRTWRTVVAGRLGASLRLIAKGWRGVAVIVAVPSFAIALMGYFEVHPLWPWEQEAESGIVLSIKVAEQAGPGIGVPGASLPEPTAYGEDIHVSEGTDLIFAVLVGLEPGFVEDEIPVTLRADLPSDEKTNHVVRVSAESRGAPNIEAASATVRLEGEPACLVYLRDSAHFLETIEGPLLERLPDSGGKSIVADGFENLAGLMSDWGVSKGVVLFQARAKESPQHSGDLADRNHSPCLPDSFGQVALLDR